MARIPKEARVPRALRRRWEPPPIPPHPYRSAALLHSVFAALIVLIAALVGADLVNAVIVAVIYFVVATGWSWFRFSQRIGKAAQKEARDRRGEGSG